MSAAFYPLSVIMGVECGSVAACCADNTCQDELSCDQARPFFQIHVILCQVTNILKLCPSFFENGSIFGRTNYENLSQIMCIITQRIHCIMV
jgi:hypothetical protein